MLAAGDVDTGECGVWLEDNVFQGMLRASQLTQQAVAGHTAAGHTPALPSQLSRHKQPCVRISLQLCTTYELPWL